MIDSGRIAILSWGSLLWDTDEQFDQWHEPWQFDGPSMKIEFSRISKSRLGALTLVIDSDNGSATTVAYCLSRRHKIGLATEDLRKREGCALRMIGYFHRDGASRHRDKHSFDTIEAWALAKAFDGVVWTDLKSNFANWTGNTFSVESALAYLARLDFNSKAKADQYIGAAPDFVQTPLRRAWRELGAIDSNYWHC